MVMNFAICAAKSERNTQKMGAVSDTKLGA